MITYLQYWKNAHQLELIILCVVFSLMVTCAFKQKIPEQQFDKYAIISSVLYGCLVLYITVFGRDNGDISTYNLELFWSYKLAFRNIGYLEQIGLNILLFVPLGILWASLLDDACLLSYGSVMLIGCLLSVSIEILQYLLACGFSELDDIISNTLGVGLGEIIWCFMRRVKGCKYIKKSQ